MSDSRFRFAQKLVDILVCIKMSRLNVLFPPFSSGIRLNQLHKVKLPPKSSISKFNMTNLIMLLKDLPKSCEVEVLIILQEDEAEVELAEGQLQV